MIWGVFRGKVTFKLVGDIEKVSILRQFTIINISGHPWIGGKN